MAKFLHVIKNSVYGDTIDSPSLIIEGGLNLIKLVLTLNMACWIIRQVSREEVTD
jgi:hypothetical protein